VPRATVDITATERYDLESVPGGYVVLRRMSYGQFLQRQEMAMQIQMTQQSNGSRRGSSGDAKMDIKNAHLAVASFEMKCCIAEHNLEDDTGNVLDFGQTFTTTILDPRVGQEIGARIDEMNKIELGNSPTESNGGSGTPTRFDGPTLTTPPVSIPTSTSS